MKALRSLNHRLNAQSQLHPNSNAKLPGILIPALLLIIITACAPTSEITRNGPESVVLPEEQTTLPQFAPVPSSLFDNGRMWTFEHAPVSYFSETYGFSPDEAWFEHARLGAVRLPNCSGSFVSPNGLVMTNHHCAREQITQVGKPGENLLDEGFYAETLEDERHISDYYVDQLIDIRDVTDLIRTRISETLAANADASPAQARQQAIRAMESELGEPFADEDDRFVQIVSLYNGGLYSAYYFRRYNDVRLVMAPELQIGYYGGDTDNFTYPRYNLDMTFYRVYVDGSPKQSDFYFPFSRRGVSEGDAVFMIGNPGSTTRQQTTAQLAYRGQFGDANRDILVREVIEALDYWYASDPEAGDEMDMRNFIFSLKNTSKLFGGMVQALRDPYLMGRRTDNENRFRAAISELDEPSDDYLHLIDRIAEIQEEKIQYSALAAVALGIAPNGRLSSSAMQRALFTFQHEFLVASGRNPDELGALRNQILNIQDRPAAFEEAMLRHRFIIFLEILGAEHPLMQTLFADTTPEELAAQIAANSAFMQAESTSELLASGIENSDDPLYKVMEIVGEDIIISRQQYSALSQAESELLSRLGRAWFEVYGTSVPPDATFSLRIADGVVASYEYNGTRAPAYTTFYGLYDRYHSHTGDPEWALPDRWKRPSLTLDLSTPINFVSTNDIIGGNSGSPVVSTRLEIVGLAFDSNIEGMGSSSFILDDRSARAVSVDVRGMLESLRHVYRADRLVKELMEAGQAR